MSPKYPIIPPSWFYELVDQVKPDIISYLNISIENLSALTISFPASDFFPALFLSILPQPEIENRTMINIDFKALILNPVIINKE